MNGINSDKRILAILLGGENLRSILDPHGLLREASLSSIHWERKGPELLWKIELCFETKDVLWLKGIFDQNGYSILSSKIKSEKESANIPVNGAKIFSEAIGELSGVPGPLKRNLSSTDLISHSFGDFNLSEYDQLLRNAASWNVEMKKDALENSFNRVSVRFNMSEGVAETVQVSFRETIQDGFIELSFNVGILGLGSKQVLFNKKIDAEHYVVCECYKISDDRKLPSLILAFQLSRDLIAKLQPAEIIQLIPETTREKVITPVRKKKQKR